MSNAAVPLFRIYELPWTTALQDDAQFKKLARVSLIVSFVVAFLLWALPQPQIEAPPPEELEKRLVRVGARAPAPPPPPAPVVREEPKPPEPEPVVEERVVEREPEPAPVVEPEPVVEPPPVDRTQQARDRARVAGLLPMASQLQALRNNVTNLDRADTVGAGSSDTAFAERSLDHVARRHGQRRHQHGGVEPQHWRQRVERPRDDAGREPGRRLCRGWGRGAAQRHQRLGLAQPRGDRARIRRQQGPHLHALQPRTAREPRACRAKSCCVSRSLRTVA